MSKKQHNFLFQITRKRINLAQNQQQEGKIKIIAQINEMESWKTIQSVNKTKTWFFENINNFGKPLARLAQKRDKTN